MNEMRSRSYVFNTIAYFMGTYFSGCRKVAELVGIKIFDNEFVAYKELSILIANNKNFTDIPLSRVGSVDLVDGLVLSGR